MPRPVLLVVALALLATGCTGQQRPTVPSARVVRAVRQIARPPLPRVVADLVARPLRYHRQTVTWLQDGVRREYVEVVPRAAAGPLALVVVLHGRRQTARRAERSQGWDRLAAGGSAVVAYAAGYGGSWNAGSCCGVAAARRLDDVGYLLEVLHRSRARHRIDPRRVFLVGFSNGGMLAYRFACAHTRAISALAVVAGSLQMPSCRPQRPLAVLAVHGDRDRIVPFDGSAYSRVAGAATRSVVGSLAAWRRIDAGTAEPVELLHLPRLGHDWPTRRNSGLDGTATIWRFLSLHPALSSAPAPAA
jgi:poly(3-hydroxybutyrate) depolymerase